MNRKNGLYTFEELWRRYRECRRNKRNTRNALAFEVDAESKLLELQQELRSRTYRPGPSICFVTDGPKPREVFAADFRDRVVHHVLVHRLEAVFEPRFIHDSYACRAGRGTLAASNRLMQFLRRVTANGHRPAWGMKLDVASFFPSIHKQTLYNIIARQVGDPEVLWLTRTILFHDPTSNYQFRSRSQTRGNPPGCQGYPIPARKSLFGKNNECGLAIGNLTSQFWANVYLNELDQFVKRDLGCRHYVRYVDDMALLSTDRAESLAWRDAIIHFLEERLRLALRAEGREPVAVRRGIDFVGWKTFHNHRVPRRQTISRLRRVVHKFERREVRPAFGALAQQLEILGPVESSGSTPLEPLRASLSAYAGHLQHGSAWGTWTRIWSEHAWLGLVMQRNGWRVATRWSGSPRGNVRLRYAHLLRVAGDERLIFFRVGRFVEFYGPQRVLAERLLRLRPVHLPRFGYAFTAGFPCQMTPRLLERVLDAGCAVVLASHAEPYRVSVVWSRRGPGNVRGPLWGRTGVSS